MSDPQLLFGLGLGVAATVGICALFLHLATRRREYLACSLALLVATLCHLLLHLGHAAPSAWSPAQMVAVLVLATSGVALYALPRPASSLDISRRVAISWHVTGMGAIAVSAAIVLAQNLLPGLAPLGGPIAVSLVVVVVGALMLGASLAFGVEALREDRERVLWRLQTRQRELEHLAHHDPLTGLPNRLLLADRVRLAFNRAARERTSFALLVMDLNGFKGINDTHGHAAGDAVLRTIGTAIADSLRATDTVARTGGDEFVVLLENVAGRAQAEQLADKLRAAATAPVRVEGASLVVGASIGLALYPDDATEERSLFAHADRAMYQEKFRQPVVGPWRTPGDASRKAVNE